MIATQVACLFVTPFKLALVTAVFVAMPLHRCTSSLRHCLRNHEKRLAIPLLASKRGAVLSGRCLRIWWSSRWFRLPDRWRRKVWR